MYRAALRSAPRIASPLRPSHVAAAGRRFASTAPADKKRSWKSSAARWALAVGAVYWYSTSTAFAEEPQLRTMQAPPAFSDEDLPTVDAVVAQKRREAEARAEKEKAAAALEATAVPASESAAEAIRASPESPAQEVEVEAGGPEALEEEAAQQGAFNPETGEINWDCPCLGGMAHGPCGEEFRAAFSCFVYSKEEPKGMDCIDKFQHMQDCFRLHPEVYGDELAEDDEAAAAVDGAPSEGLSARDASANGDAAAAEPAKAVASAEETTSTDLKTGEAKSERERVSAAASAKMEEPTSSRAE
ncbi:hypothetical protein F4802DRAFT_570312 [Xylaria palmicola]|nr:hypothetical protein F4802DRAFT_570312 [Xylaria palmicola]